eukprot:Awhi_evm1s11723
MSNKVAPVIDATNEASIDNFKPIEKEISYDAPVQETTAPPAPPAPPAPALLSPEGEEAVIPTRSVSSVNSANSSDYEVDDVHNSNPGSQEVAEGPASQSSLEGPAGKSTTENDITPEAQTAYTAQEQTNLQEPTLKGGTSFAEFTEDEFAEFMKHPYYLAKARQEHTLKEPFKPALTGLVPTCPFLEKSVSEIENMIEKSQKICRTLEKKENKKQEKEIKKLEKELKSMEKKYLKKLTAADKRKPSADRLGSLKLTENARRKVFPIAKRYDDELQRNYLQNMKHIYSVRHVDMVSLQKVLGEKEDMAIADLETAEDKELGVAQKREISELNHKERGFFNRHFGKKKEEFLVQESKLTDEQQDKQRQLLEKQTKRREEIAIKHKQMVKELDNQFVQFKASVFSDQAV